MIVENDLAFARQASAARGGTLCAGALTGVAVDTHAWMYVAGQTGLFGSAVLRGSRQEGKPDETPRKLLDISRLPALGWTASTLCG